MTATTSTPSAPIIPNGPATAVVAARTKTEIATPTPVAPATPSTMATAPTTVRPQSAAPVQTPPTPQKAESFNVRPKFDQAAPRESATPAGFRRFTCTEDGANKFWEVAAEGTELTVRFGRIGTRGQMKQKTFASAVESTREKEKLIREKVGKGYVEQSA